MRVYLIILIWGLSFGALAQDLEAADTSDLYLKKPGILLVSSIPQSDIVGSFICNLDKWDNTSIKFLADGRFTQNSWISCSYNRFDDSGTWKLVKPQTLEITSARQNVRFNLVRSQGSVFLIPYSRAQEFINMALMAQAVRKGEITNLDKDEIYLYEYEGGIWKKLFYRKGGG